MEAQVPRECSRSPLHDPAPSEGRINEFSSQEDSVADDTVASVFRVLSPGAYHHIMLDQQGGNTITVHLGAAESAPACRSISTDSFADSSKKSRSRKRKQDKKR